MRALFAIASLVITWVSLILDYAHPSPGSSLCREGLCRYDQVFAALDAHGVDLPGVAALLSLDPSNPLVWCTYGELLSGAGRTQEAASAFQQAVTLGPGMSPVLMRAANFDFAQGRLDHAFAMTNRILRQSDTFDQVVFSYLTYSGLPVSRLAGVAVPPVQRAARSWFFWLRGSGSIADLRELWSWMRQNQLLDQNSAADFAWALWHRNAFITAQDSWANWLGPSQDDYLHPQRLANVRFKNEPSGSPFDWALTPAVGAEIGRNDGLEIRFSRTENAEFANVRQFTTVSSGRYRFSAEISAKDITTDQGLFFHIFDPVNPGHLSVESVPAKGTVPRSWITLEVPVRPNTQALEIQIERRPSQKFDNKIGGTLHVYQVSLVPIP
jgi:tetratricopeptide (TPR) repeat protein